jgi:hypothetical protein
MPETAKKNDYTVSLLDWSRKKPSNNQERC